MCVSCDQSSAESFVVSYICNKDTLVPISLSSQNDEYSSVPDVVKGKNRTNTMLFLYQPSQAVVALSKLTADMPFPHVCPKH